MILKQWEELFELCLAHKQFCFVSQLNFHLIFFFYATATHLSHDSHNSQKSTNYHQFVDKCSHYKLTVLMCDLATPNDSASVNYATTMGHRVFMRILDCTVIVEWVDDTKIEDHTIKYLFQSKIGHSLLLTESTGDLSLLFFWQVSKFVTSNQKPQMIDCKFRMGEVVHLYSNIFMGLSHHVMSARYTSGPQSIRRPWKPLSICWLLANISVLVNWEVSL